MTPEQVAAWFGDADDVRETEYGSCWVFRSVKWRSDDTTVVAMLAFLAESNPDGSKYLVLEACHDYPAYCEGDHGQWHDNPWGMHRYVSCGIDFCELDGDGDPVV